MKNNTFKIGDTIRCTKQVKFLNCKYLAHNIGDILEVKENNIDYYNHPENNQFYEKIVCAA